MGEENKDVALWPGEPPPPYGEEGKKAWEDWEKKAHAFCETIEGWDEQRKQYK